MDTDFRFCVNLHTKFPSSLCGAVKNIHSTHITEVTHLPPKKAANLIKQQTPDRPLPLSFAGGQTRFGPFPIWISKELRAVPQVTSIDGPPSGGVLRGRHQREHVLEVDHLL